MAPKVQYKMLLGGTKLPTAENLVWYFQNRKMIVNLFYKYILSTTLPNNMWNLTAPVHYFLDQNRVPPTEDDGQAVWMQSARDE